MDRKRRSDCGKQRKLYRGRPVKRKMKRHGHLVPYVSKRTKFDPIKLQIIKLEPMSKEGFMNFNRKSRGFMKPTVFSSVRLRIDAYPEDISTKEQIGNLVIDNFGFEGTFDVRMSCHAKNVFHSSFKRVCLVKVYDSENGFYAQIFPTFRLSRYWFFKNR